MNQFNLFRLDIHHTIIYISIYNNNNNNNNNNNK